MQVEAEAEAKIRCLRTDNGLEYTSAEFKNFCLKQGIKRHLIAPYSQHQNGVVERKNKIVVEMGRSILTDKKLPLHLWAEDFGVSAK